MVGEVHEVTADYVVLGKAGNYGLQTTRIPADEIVSIELDAGAKPRDAALGVFAVAMATVALFFISLGQMGLN